MKKKFILSFVILMICSVMIFSGCAKEENILVDSISISKKNLYLAEGQTAEISAQVFPFNASNQNFEFISSNENIVKVENGFVKAIKAGNAQITVISDEGGYTDSCNVLVTTAKNNLSINNYNNLNMPNQNSKIQKTKNTNNQNFQKTSKKTQKNHKKSNILPTNSTNIAKINTAKDYINNIKAKTLNEISTVVDAGKNVFEDIKTDIEKTINDFDEEKEKIVDDANDTAKEKIKNTIDEFKKMQIEIFESMQNIQQQMINDIEKMKDEIDNQMNDVQSKIDSGEYTVETKDINGIKFVVITNNQN